eukprot:TRINITY_DN1612_c0_g2_i1.p1 TRINITY_DN1612_c0_g2~~TRINITY_DN1612_c0_g2_i1.p1  ORF type:complete len:317 (-),score=52.00 TRINITY_DN1612_c0_g2_i1:234-1184(-)
MKLKLLRPLNNQSPMIREGKHSVDDHAAVPEAEDMEKELAKLTAFVSEKEKELDETEAAAPVKQPVAHDKRREAFLKQATITKNSFSEAAKAISSSLEDFKKYAAETPAEEPAPVATPISVTTAIKSTPTKPTPTAVSPARTNPSTTTTRTTTPTRPTAGVTTTASAPSPGVKVTLKTTPVSSPAKIDMKIASPSGLKTTPVKPAVGTSPAKIEIKPVSSPTPVVKLNPVAVKTTVDVKPAPAISVKPIVVSAPKIETPPAIVTPPPAVEVRTQTTEEQQLNKLMDAMKGLTGELDIGMDSDIDAQIAALQAQIGS